MAMWKWIKEKYQNRRAGKEDHDPWWVTLMLDVGRPLVAVLILVMCAPGEHYLAMEAGWSQTLAWGMPGTLTAYAGIAAVVATKRKKGAPGRKTAISGAVISILLAMAAQPIAHLYGKIGLHPEQIALTIAAGLIPAAVFGHLLHMGAAAPKPDKLKTAPAAEPDKGAMIPAALDNALKPITPRAYVLSEMDKGVVPAADTITWTGQPDTDKDNRTPDVSEADDPGTAGQDTPDTPGQDISRTEDLQELSAVRPVRPTNVRSIKKGSLSADVRAYLSEHPDADDSDLAAAMAIKWPDKPWDSVRKARDRYQEKQEKTS